MVGFATTAKTHVFANDDLSQVLETDELVGDTKFSKTKSESPRAESRGDTGGSGPA